MQDDPQLPTAPFQRVFFLLAGTVIGVFSAAVLIGIGLFRGEIREQILQRDGILLTNVAQYLYEEQGDSSRIVDWDLLELALDSSKIKGVIAVRVYRPVDRLIEQVPVSLYAVSLSPEDRLFLKDGEPVIRYFAGFRLDTLFSDIEEIGESDTSPLIEVIAPLANAEGAVEASIQYWLDGSRVAEEFHRLDQYLLFLGTVFLAGGGILFAIVFLYARKRLIGMGRLLADRNRSLRRANAELALAARTSAIGSITSHLFHGLKNPLAGLKAYLKVTAHDEEAIAITDRMQSLINETLDVIRNEDGDMHAQITFAELEELARKRLGAADTSRAGRIRISASGSGSLESRQAQLLLLVLRNLVDNAAEASGQEDPIEVRLESREDGLLATVRDRGPGLPHHVRDRIFEPVNSGKSNGAGIGLAISAVLARHIPATLKLVRSDAQGTEFSIHMPL